MEEVECLVYSTDLMVIFTEYLIGILEQLLIKGSKNAGWTWIPHE